MITSPRSRHTGFTLIECVITLGVASLLAGLAMPSLREIRKQAELRSTISALTSELALARVSAITRNTPYVLCPTDDGLRCARGGRWNTDWLGFHDANRDLQPDNADALSVHPRRSGRLKVFSGSGRPHIRYLPDGRSPGTNATFKICDDATILARVVVNNAGRARTERTNSPEACSAD